MKVVAATVGIIEVACSALQLNSLLQHVNAMR